MGLAPSIPISAKKKISTGSYSCQILRSEGQDKIKKASLDLGSEPVQGYFYILLTRLQKDFIMGPQSMTINPPLMVGIWRCGKI